MGKTEWIILGLAVAIGGGAIAWVMLSKKAPKAASPAVQPATPPPAPPVTSGGSGGTDWLKTGETALSDVGKAVDVVSNISDVISSW